MGDDTKKKTRREELDEERSARQDALAKQREEQLDKDLEAMNELELEHGDSSVARLDVKNFIPGLPAIIVVRSPGGTTFYKRYLDMLRKGAKNPAMQAAAQEMLGDSCWVYPADKDTRKSMLEQFPGLLISAFARAIKFVELEEVDEKKG